MQRRRQCHLPCSRAPKTIATAGDSALAGRRNSLRTRARMWVVALAGACPEHLHRLNRHHYRGQQYRRRWQHHRYRHPPHQGHHLTIVTTGAASVAENYAATIVTANASTVTTGNRSHRRCSQSVRFCNYYDTQETSYCVATAIGVDSIVRLRAFGFTPHAPLVTYASACRSLDPTPTVEVGSSPPPPPLPPPMEPSRASSQPPQPLVAYKTTLAAPFEVKFVIRFKKGTGTAITTAATVTTVYTAVVATGEAAEDLSAPLATPPPSLATPPSLEPPSPSLSSRCW